MKQKEIDDPILSSPSLPENWIPLGLLIEPLKPQSLERQRQQSAKAWLLAPLDKKQSETLLLYKKSKAASDIYQRTPLILLRQTTQHLQTLQAHILKQGLARLDMSQLSPSCAQHLQKFEQFAQTRKLGLWAISQYQIRDAQDLHLSDTVSTYQIVKGTVVSVSRKPKKISYLNFGTHWKQDFTATLSAKMLTIWEQQGHSLDELKGQTVYVRGWIENRDGALIRITHPQHLYMQDQGSGQ